MFFLFVCLGTQTITLTFESGSALPVYLQPVVCWTLAGVGHISCQGLDREEVSGGTGGFFAFVLVLVQYESEASGSLRSRRKVEESGSVDTKKTQGTA